jgi:hypothetical protein
MFIAGPGQSANPTTAIGQNFPSTDALDILLNPGITAIAFDIYQNFGGGAQAPTPQPYSVSIFGTSGLLGTTLVSVPSGGGFFGVSSTTDLITGVSVNNATAYDVIDDVAFGSANVQPVPEPASFIFTLTGITVLGAGSLVARYRRKRA